MRPRLSRSLLSDPDSRGNSPTGACYTNITSGDKVCQTPSFTPMFSELYDDISMPPQVSDALTTQFPFSPTFIFISLCLIFIEFIFVTALAIGMHKPQGNLAFIARKQHRLVRLSLLIGLVALVLGLAATGALRIVIASDISAAQGIPGVEAEVGTGFARSSALPLLVKSPLSTDPLPPNSSPNRALGRVHPAGGGDAALAHRVLPHPTEEGQARRSGSRQTRCGFAAQGVDTGPTETEKIGPKRERSFARVMSLSPS